MPGSYPNYTENTQDTQYDIPGRKDLANAADYNDHDREILAHQAILVNHNGRIVLLEAAAAPSLSSLTDTTISLPASGQVLVYNGSSWVNAFDIFPDYSASLPVTLSNGVIGFNSSYLSPSGIPFSSIHMTSTNLQDAVVEAFLNPVQVANHATLTNLDYANSGHTGFQPSGNYLISETDPLSLHLDQTTPQTVTGGSPVFSAGITFHYSYAGDGNLLIETTGDYPAIYHVGEYHANKLMDLDTGIIRDQNGIGSVMTHIRALDHAD